MAGPQGPSTIPPGPAWAAPGNVAPTQQAAPAIAPVATSAPRRNASAFDRANSNARIAVPAQLDPFPSLAARAGAFVIDALIVAVVLSVYLVGGAIAYGLGELERAGDGDAIAGAGTLFAEAPGMATACLLLLFVVTSGYFVWFQGAESRTPGMAVFGLRVVKADGSPLGMWGAIQRWGAFLIATALFGLGILWTAFSEVQHGLHDHLSGTSVRRA